MTARVPLSSVASSLLCLEKQNYMRSRCTNSTQGIQYPHAGRCLLSTELHRGFYTFPRGCCFPRQAAQNPAARSHSRTEVTCRVLPSALSGKHQNGSIMRDSIPVASLSVYTIHEHISLILLSCSFFEVQGLIPFCAQKPFPIFLSKSRNLVP